MAVDPSEEARYSAAFNSTPSIMDPHSLPAVTRPGFLKGEG